MKDRDGFRDALAAWFSEHGKEYPWRWTRDPYAVLVSEVMLQQTRIATVLGKGYFTRFLERFPDVGSLAAADDAALLKAWEGLGYYRRARMLRETARTVMERHNGRFPEDVAELSALPGIGPYTSGALRAFAFEADAVLVDGNIARVLARIMDFDGAVDRPDGIRTIRRWAGELADSRRPRVYHSALMELGQTHCRPGVPDCGGCPVARYCRCRRPAELPVKSAKVAVTAVEEHALWARDRRGRILLHQESGARRTGLWRLPLRAAESLAGLELIAEHVYSITRYRVALRVYRAAAAVRPAIGEKWIDPADHGGLAMASPFRKVLEHLIKDF